MGSKEKVPKFTRILVLIIGMSHLKSTIAISVDEFTDLYTGPVFEERKTGGEDCPGFCLYKDNLEPCPAECECAYVREVIQIIKKE